MNVDLLYTFQHSLWKNINVDLYILFQHLLLEEYNNQCCSLYTFPILIDQCCSLYFSTFIVGRIQRSILIDQCCSLYFSTFIVGRIQRSMLFFIYFSNIHCWKNITINVDLYILFQHLLLKEYNNECCSLYTFPTFIVGWIQRSMLFFIYFFNIHCWKEYNNKCWSLCTFPTFIVERNNYKCCSLYFSTFIQQ